MEALELQEVQFQREFGLLNADREATVISKAFEVAKAKATLEAEERKLIDLEQRKGDAEVQQPARMAASKLKFEFRWAHQLEPKLREYEAILKAPHAEIIAFQRKKISQLETQCQQLDASLAGLSADLSSEGSIKPEEMTPANSQ